MNLVLNENRFNCPICQKPMFDRDKDEKGVFVLKCRFTKFDLRKKTALCRCRICGNTVESPLKFSVSAMAV